MGSPEPAVDPPWVKRVLLVILVGVLLGVCYLVLRPFAQSLLWTAILAYVTWPLHRRVKDAMRGRKGASALVTTVLVTSLLVLPVLVLVPLLHVELVSAYQAFTKLFNSRDPKALLDLAARVPIFGGQLEHWLANHVQDPAWLPAQLMALAQRWSSELLSFAGGVARTTAQAVVMLLILFFVYRDGESALVGVRTLLARHLSGTMDPYVRAAGSMIRVVVFGSLVTALAQGAIAGLGYWIFGIPGPALLGALTTLTAFVPIFGTALIYVPLCASLLLSGEIWTGLGLLAWCVILVHPIDNILRPLLISSSTRIPFLFAMLGALGGLAAFGLIGLFVGPVSLALLIAVWDTWTSGGAADSAPPSGSEAERGDRGIEQPRGYPASSCSHPAPPKPLQKL